MSADDLSSPLGQKSARKPRVRLPFSLAQALAAMSGVFIAGFAGFALFNDNPLGGEPIKSLPITAELTPAPKASAASEPSAVPATNTAPQQTVTIIDGSSGARHSVAIGGDASLGSDTAPAALIGIDPRLIEATRFGDVPISAGGITPLTAYATGTPAERAKAATMPIVAVVVSGLGIGVERTNQAILKLPPAITLAFTPYGGDVSKFAAQARAKQHELLLQIPMEPFEYPDNDPGPQTLLATSSAEQNVDRLLWHLSRFKGYVGVSNYMGAKFVATEGVMRPILADITKRGLAWFDDAAVARNVSATQAKLLNTPYARADLTIDATPTTADVDASLLKLERIARERGVAIGAASALPVSVERINSWAEGLASRGIMLVPLTTAMQKPRPG